MNLRNRQLLLRLAKLLDRWAFRLRRYVEARTPKRKRHVAAANDR